MASSNEVIRNHAAFIWSVADLLRGDYKQSEYGRVILPLTVLRRLDCVLEPTKAKVLAKLAKQVAPPSIKRHLAEREAERERRERAYQEEQAARLAEQRAQLAAGEAVRCAGCFQPITATDEAAEKHGSLVHAGDCEQEWGANLDDDDVEAV